MDRKQNEARGFYSKMNNNYQEIFHDGSARLPASHRFTQQQQQQQQGLQRQGSRQFDAYGQMSSHNFNVEDRFESSRFDRMAPGLGSGGFSNFEGGAQTWNPNAFGSFNTFNLGRTVKSNARGGGRSILPSVCVKKFLPSGGNFDGLTAKYRHGSINQFHRCPISIN